MFFKYGVIYKITNLINGKIYIGKTKKTIEIRWCEHKKPSSKSCSYLKSALKHYDPKNFKIEEIATCFSKESLNETEIYLIKFYNSTNSSVGYNLSTGGEGGEFSEQTRLKLSLALKGKNKRPKTEEEKKHLSKIFTGRKFSLATKHKMSNSLMGNTYNKNNPKTSKVIISYNLVTKEIISYPSTGEVVRSGFNRPNLYKALKNITLVFRNCFWFYENDFDLDKKKKLLIKKLSEIKGIRFHKRDALWVARIKINNRQKYLGSSKNRAVALFFYRDALLKKHPEYLDIISEYGWR